MCDLLDRLKYGTQWSVVCGSTAIATAEFTLATAVIAGVAQCAGVAVNTALSTAVVTGAFFGMAAGATFIPLAFLAVPKVFEDDAYQRLLVLFLSNVCATVATCVVGLSLTPLSVVVYALSSFVAAKAFLCTTENHSDARGLGCL